MKKIFLILSLFGLVQIELVSAQKNYPAMLNKYMQAQVNANDFSGAVLVAYKGNIIYKKGFGYADREWKLINTTDTKFQICSLTKQFTAAAILQLAEQRRLNLYDKLSAYFPGYPKGDSITLHMLLNHTSGIADYTGLPGFNAIRTQSLSKDSVIGLFKNQPYRFSPGTKWDYSNSNYFLLGYIIEKVTKQPYDVYLYKNVIQKAGLRNTAVNETDSVLANRAMGYTKAETGGWKNAEQFPTGLVYSAGSVISTITDLYNWQKALAGGKIVSPDMLAKMTTPYLKNYGYGLTIDTLEHHRRIWHGGAAPGFTSYLCSFPAEEISIVILSNNFSNSNLIGDALASILFDRPVQLPYKIVERPINTAVLKRYPGKYQLSQSSGTMYFELINENEKLYLKPEGAGDFKMELKPESETRFFFARDHDQEIEFVVDAKGGILKCALISKGARFEIKKRI
ncbi:serine hydrolase [Mucilaginibacter sp.]|uniref:serine hydrolase n=1 Tax=Mucilaginibacter sp. TaxID=1882438 RepID=UPI0025F7EC65|nr:serine hydrolase [Mucilaginibacter sp.]